MADLIQANSVLRETLVGDSLPFTPVAIVHNVLRETLIKEAPVLVLQVVREALVRLENDDATIRRIAEGLRQTVVMKRPAMAAPGTVHSTTTLATLRQLVAMKRVLPPVLPRSPIDVMTLRGSSVHRRVTPPAPTMHSAITTASYCEQVVLSRVRVYVPVSMVYVRNLREQAVTKLDVVPAPQMWSPLTVRTLVEQIVQSRRIATITTDVFAAALVQQAVTKNVQPAPHSPTDVSRMIQQVVQVRDVVAPGSDRRVGALVEQAVQVRDVDETAIGMVEAHALRMLTTMRRDTYPPAAAAGRHAAALNEQVVMRRDTVMTEGAAIVPSMRVLYTMFRKTPLPIDVIDPTVGRHVGALHQQSVIFRATLPPPEVKDPHRIVYQLREQVVARDLFDAPPQRPSEVIAFNLAEQVAARDIDFGPVSRLTVTSAAEAVAHKDAGPWADPFVPTSEVTAYSVFEAVAHNEFYVNPNDLLSAAQVIALSEVAAVGDNVGWIDPLMPQSAIVATSVHEAVAVGDPGWEDPRIPHSNVTVSALHENVVVHDEALSGHFLMSSIRVMMLATATVVTDPSLVGIPKRTGPRPLVSVSIS